MTTLADTGGDAVERYVYDPYGKVSVLDADFSADADGTSDYDNPILYSGYYRDSETGLDCVRHRYYHPTLGRWLSTDPIRMVSGIHHSPWSITGRAVLRAQRRAARLIGPGADVLLEYSSGASLYAYWQGNPGSVADASGLVMPSRPLEQEEIMYNPIEGKVDGLSCCLQWSPPHWERSGFKSRMDCVNDFVGTVAANYYEDTGAFGLLVEGIISIVPPVTAGQAIRWGIVLGVADRVCIEQYCKKQGVWINRVCCPVDSPAAAQLFKDPEMKKKWRRCGRISTGCSRKE